MEPNDHDNYDTFQSVQSPVNIENKYNDGSTPTTTTANIPPSSVKSPMSKPGPRSRTNSSRSARVTRLDTEYSNDPYSTSSLRKSTTIEKPRRTIQQIFGYHNVGATNYQQEPNNLEDGEFRASTDNDDKIRTSSLLLRLLGAIGVVYGDIGTSPIYTLGPVFSDKFKHSKMPTKEDIVGTISNLLWLLFIVVCIKYCCFVMRADYHGEGGTFAMYEKLVAHKHKISKTGFALLTGLACTAASLLIGDATITPAISVISALEGISQVQPVFKDYIVYVSVVIIGLLFALQYKGTATIGLLFGPILVTWFFFIGSLGLYSLITYGIDILDALNPYNALKWWRTGTYAGSAAFNNMANIVLALTGAEVMFADMGHFGRNAIYVTWFGLVFPTLLLQYLGQGAYLINMSKPSSTIHLSDSEMNQLYANLANSPFWSMIPKESSMVYFYYIVIVLGTLATIVASQSVITGAFTLMNQASALGFFPRLNVVYTNSEQKGQVYIGSVCLIQGVMCAIIVMIFQSSENLTAAFGAAVTSVFLITTIILCFYIAPVCWRYRSITCVALFIIFGTIDAILWTSSMGKVPHGAWLPLVMGICVISIMGIWTTTRRWVSECLDAIVESSWKKCPLTLMTNPDTKRMKLIVSPSVARCEGVGIFLTPSKGAIPLSLTKLCSRLKACPRHILFVTVKTNNQPFVGEWDRLEFEEIDKNDDGSFYSAVIHHGWAEPLSSLNILLLLRAAALNEEYRYSMPTFLLERFASLTYDDDEDSARFMRFEEPLSIFTTVNKVKPANNRTIFGSCIIGIYKFLKSALSPTTVEYFRLPPDNTTELGVSILV